MSAAGLLSLNPASMLMLLALGMPLLQIVAAPPSLAITSLHVSHQMSYSISQASVVALCAVPACNACVQHFSSLHAHSLLD